MSVVPISYAAAYAGILVTFVALDAAWLSVMGGYLYRPTLGDILLPALRFGPAAAFYLLFPIGLVVFAAIPALRTGSLATAVGCGALFGALAYATYDLTNFATLRNWTLQLTLLDIGYGAVVSALAATAGFYLARYATV